MDAAKLTSFLQRGPFIATGDHCVVATHTGSGYGDIIARCCNGRCPDGTVIGADEVAVYIAEALNGLMRDDIRKRRIE